LTENVASHSLVIGDERLEIPGVLPVLPVRDAVVFPGMSVPLAIGRARSLAALDAAGTGGFLVVATQRDPQTEDPGLDDLYPIACITRVVRIVDARREGKQAIVVGLLRARLTAVDSTDPAFRVRIEPIPDSAPATAELETARARVLELAKKVIDLRDDIPDEWKQGLESLGTPGLLADLIASYVRLPGDERVKLLQEPSPVARLWRLVPHLDREVTIAEAQKHLAGDEAEEVDPEQRERILRRRARDIEREIGEGDGGQREVDELRDKLDAANLPADARDQADRELRRLRALPSHAPDRHLIRTYLEWLADLPWSVETTDHLDLAAAREVLDADHHDLEKEKDRILEFLAVRMLAPEAKAPILCFVGPPGVGKT
jgi:ATP-dependent Lon protease